nr:transglycosylase domain-containing protein [Propylenella binzhouense]
MKALGPGPALQAVAAAAPPSPSAPEAGDTAAPADAGRETAPDRVPAAESGAAEADAPRRAATEPPRHLDFVPALDGQVPARGRGGVRRFLGKAAGVSLGLALVVAAVGIWIGRDLPFGFVNGGPGAAATVLAAADGSPVAPVSAPLAAGDLPDDLANAVLVAVDRQFFDQNGIDFSGVWSVVWSGLVGRSGEETGSLAQQLSRSAFIAKDASLKRRLQEAVLTAALEWRLDRRAILSRFLDGASFGNAAIGVRSAARIYFDKDVADLDLPESAFLAGLLGAPPGFDPRGADAAEAVRRANGVIDGMRGQGFVAPDRAEAAKADPARPVGAAAPGGWYAEWVQGQAQQRFGPILGEFRIGTTLRPDLQEKAEAAVRKGLATLRPEQKVGQVALVAMTYDGAVVAMVGGRSAAEGGPNRATEVRRELGSAGSLFVYLAAIRAGWTPNDRLLDAPLRVEQWRPGTGSADTDVVDLKGAFARSLHGPTRRLASEVGTSEVLVAARNLGLDVPFGGGAADSIEDVRASLLELTGAYASIAAGSGPVRPYGLASVSAPATGGEPLSVRPAGLGQRIEQGPALVQLLENVVTEGTGQRAALGRFAAGKTGTSRDFRDAWFVGFTDDLVAGVWVGNDDGSPMNGMTGGELPAVIWRDFMVAAGGAGNGPARLGRLDPPKDQIAGESSAAPGRAAASFSADGPLTTEGLGLLHETEDAISSASAEEARGVPVLPVAPLQEQGSPAIKRTGSAASRSAGLPGGAWKSGTGVHSGNRVRRAAPSSAPRR